ncbi:phosphate-starvation-inducible protein PsiE [Glaesserella sp.]|uniref:phosphate-starvation-inducible protein PsiE n=1 Tax=Glaesserella sp. TaxID=2094731 RepID=UPI0035A0F27D
MPKVSFEGHHSILGKWISEIFQWILNISLLVAGAILAYALFSEAYELFKLLISHGDKYHFIERIVVFFLYFEFLALIVMYFKYHYHFPLRYFLYVGITAMIRLIIVDHSNPMHTLLFALAILVMVVALFIVHSERLRKS